MVGIYSFKNFELFCKQQSTMVTAFIKQVSKMGGNTRKNHPFLFLLAKDRMHYTSVDVYTYICKLMNFTCINNDYICINPGILHIEIVTRYLSSTYQEEIFCKNYLFYVKTHV